MALDLFKTNVLGLASFFTLPSPCQLLQLPLTLHSLASSRLPLTQDTQSTLQSEQSCPQPINSCPPTLPQPIDTCCLNYPSGHFLLAQFWDTNPALGPKESWTLHGLWPDLCTGGFDQFCDDSRNLGLREIATIVDKASDPYTGTHPGLRDYMDEYWKGLTGDDVLWMHEWNKHGTCVSTLEPNCYPKDNPTSSPSTVPNNKDLLDYFAAATTLHSTLQSHSILASHGIIPSHSKTYTLASIQSALKSAHGFIGTVKCNYHGELNEIWMHYTIRGPLRNFTSPADVEIFIPAGLDGIISTCPKTSIKYLPKGSKTAPRPHPPLPPSRPNPPSNPPFTGKGHLQVRVLRDDPPNSTTETKHDTTESNINEGCLIRQGQWYKSGTCATYRTKSDASHLDSSPYKSGVVLDVTDSDAHLFTLTSSNGPCAVLEQDGGHGEKGEFACAVDLPVQSIFGSGDGGEVLTWQGTSVFFADKEPEKFEKVKVFVDDGNGARGVRLEVYWEGL